MSEAVGLVGMLLSTAGFVGAGIGAKMAIHAARVAQACAKDAERRAEDAAKVIARWEASRWR